MMKKKQSDLVLEYIRKNGKITQMDALRDLGVMRLASRISDLRKSGADIRKRMVAVNNRDGEKCLVAEYYI